MQKYISKYFLRNANLKKKKNEALHQKAISRLGFLASLNIRRNVPVLRNCSMLVSDIVQFFFIIPELKSP